MKADLILPEIALRQYLGKSLNGEVALLRARATELSVVRSQTRPVS